ncbi:hypothetical protein SSP531S_09680 [Streptomyces spongiicola]|uniref:Uncharacterized protein n=1 Tax=Streptomyces spongiicola TaxID=1690221 RepID=A0A2S1Z815_9ACTN|nr:hypothetical protein DDQ41_30360 [Streptomyces spongiicola]GBP99573.1 hypothetical protein SSP531S_09680 [Streptomyces spongiicola]
MRTRSSTSPGATPSGCLRPARRAFRFGGPTGTVVGGATEWPAADGDDDLTSVAIARDPGERYPDPICRNNRFHGPCGRHVPARRTAAAPSPAA